MPVTAIGDPREQRGAYITDNVRLYMVLDSETARDNQGLAKGMKPRRVWLENAASGLVVVVDSQQLKARMKLVRAAPADVGEIAA